jgi:predicted nucleic acid-binding protein
VVPGVEPRRFALLDARDPDHERAAAWLDSNTLPLVTTDYVFDETVTLTRKELGHRAAVTFGENLQASSLTQMVSIALEDRKAGWLVFKKYKDQKLSFTDCTSFAVMRRLGLRDVLSTDRHFKMAGFTLVLAPDR